MTRVGCWARTEQACGPSGEGGAQPASTKLSGRPAHVFIGIKIASAIADELAEFAAALERASVRPVAPADIHLTLVPPWNESSVPEAIAKLGRVVARFHPFSLAFRHVGYGPQLKRPRLIWAECAATDEMAALRTALLQAFGQTDDRPFRPHVTLGRIRTSGHALMRKHPIDRSLSLTQRVETVELFQSPSPGESGYRILSSMLLADTPASNQPA